MSSLRVAEKQGPHDTRATNLRVLLQLLWHSEGMSRADLARASGLTRASVSDMVTELASDGLVEEVGRVFSRVGKPGILLAVRPTARVVIALDVRPTAIRGALVNLAGEFIHRVEVPLGGRSGEHVVDAIEEAIAYFVEMATSPILGVGIGTTGLVDHQAVVIRATHLGWSDLPLGRRLQDKFQIPVLVENDANAAALAEFSYGALTTLDETAPSLMVLRVGNGVGGGIVIDGRLYRGDSSAAGEVGHIVVEPGGKPCSCGNTGCLEAYVSRPLIDKALADGEAPNEVAVAAGSRLGTALASALTVLDIHRVVVSGVPPIVGEPLCLAATQRIQERALPSLAKLVTVRQSTMGEDVILLGAHTSVLASQLGVA